MSDHSDEESKSSREVDDRESESEESDGDHERGEENDEDENDEDELQDDKEEDEVNEKPDSESKPRKVHRLSLTKTQDFNEKLRKRGVVYIARIPPRMTPVKLKQFLGDYNVTRVYCVEEDAAKRKRRRKLTGNGAKRYTEGWIEFESKKVAKSVAAALNNTRMSHKKPHCDDLWNLKYLSKFQWSHLTEKVAYERRVREQRLRLETMQAKRETAVYKNMVEAGKKRDKIEEKRRRKAEKQGLPVEAKKRQRVERQIAPISDDGIGKSSKKALLRSIV